MYSYLIDDLAQAELDAVGGLYISYFVRLGDPARGRAWANRFYAEYRREVGALRKSPRRRPACTVYPFDLADTEYRSFVVGWLTIFHAAGDSEQSFTVWHVRSSKSDFSNMRRR